MKERLAPSRTWIQPGWRPSRQIRPPADPAPLPLLDLEAGLGERGVLASLVGVSDEGRPLVVDLRVPETSHVVVRAPEAWGKSTLLRTIIGSLCLRARPWQVGMAGIDLSGRELSLLEALPHRIAPVAHAVGEASELLAWLEGEVEARLDREITAPAMLVAVDDLAWLADPDQASSLRRMARILRVGARVGVHVIAAIGEPPPAELSPLFDVPGSVVAVARGGGTRGMFEFRSRGWQGAAQAAYLSAGDLNQLVMKVSGQAPGASGPSGPEGSVA